jgi:hypothetical protein
MFEKKRITQIYFWDRGIPKIHVIAEDGKAAVGKITPIFDKDGKPIKCLYCEALGYCP